MKKLIAALFIGLSIMACSNDDSQNPLFNNPFLIEPVVNLNLNLNLPEYNPLKFSGQSVIIAVQGIKGIVVYNIDNEEYTAFELSDPNHMPNACSTMIVKGTIASCTCGDGNEYNIINGQHFTDQTKYPMLLYRAERDGDIVHVFN